MPGTQICREQVINDTYNVTASGPDYTLCCQCSSRTAGQLMSAYVYGRIVYILQKYASAPYSCVSTLTVYLYA